MEFLLVPIIFALALIMLSIGKLLGKDKELHSCKGGDGDSECTTCANPDMDFNNSKDDPGFSNVAKLGDPNRKTRFIDKLDFKPERFK